VTLRERGCTTRRAARPPRDTARPSGTTSDPRSPTVRSPRSRRRAARAGTGAAATAAGEREGRAENSTSTGVSRAACSVVRSSSGKSDIAQGARTRRVDFAALQAVNSTRRLTPARTCRVFRNPRLIPAADAAGSAANVPPIGPPLLAVEEAPCYGTPSFRGTREAARAFPPGRSLV
jgi:hypothetical protein